MTYDLRLCGSLSREYETLDRSVDIMVCSKSPVTLGRFHSVRYGTRFTAPYFLSFSDVTKDDIASLLRHNDVLGISFSSDAQSLVDDSQKVLVEEHPFWEELLGNLNKAQYEFLFK